ncbi:MAG: isoprenyl transferase [Acidobacteria bacterium]|nr:isoprenyl transferase [Acidobacteriota bacterium]
MDGNGRWATHRHLPRVAGHRAGIRSVREIVETSARLGIQVLTLYAFSVENWKRPKSEINVLMRLLKEYLRRELPEIKRRNIRFRTIGRTSELPASIQRELDYAIRETRENTGMIMNIALNYGGRTELVDAFNRLLQDLRTNGGNPEVGEQEISSCLYTSGMPDPDLLIRTSGELRVSNFLLWQIAYSELWVTDTLWPDFRKHDLFQAVVDFQKRHRRYGGIGNPDSSSDAPRQ